MSERWRPSAPILCLVTHRRALADALGQPAGSTEPLREQVAAAVEAGVDLVHVRERDLEAGALCDLVGRLSDLARDSATRVVVNDRADVAVAAGAHGVHLRADSIDARRLRQIVPGPFLLGQSVRDVDGVTAGAGSDYFVVGTLFETPSHPGRATVVGLEGLARVAAATARPVLGIGGIEEGRLAEVARQGAAGVAAIRLFFRPPEGWSALAGRVARWRRMFDIGRADFLT